MVSLSAQSLKVLRQRIPLFDGFTDTELSYLMSRSVRRTLSDGEQLIGDGGLSTRLFIIVSGEAGVYRNIGGKEMLIANLRPGATVGEMGVVDCAPRSARVVAQGSTTILELEQSLFEDADPSVVGRLFRNIAAILAQRVRQANDSISTPPHAQPPTRERSPAAEAGFNEQDLSGVSARGANMSGGLFQDANFEGGVFTDANFEDANFQGANFQKADLRGANLDGALFDDDLLIGANPVVNAVVANPMAEENLEQGDIDSLAADLIGEGEVD